MLKNKKVYTAHAPIAHGTLYPQQTLEFMRREFGG